MAYYGYHRVSTKEQHENRGIFELEAFCSEKGSALSGGIFCDKQTGKNFNRSEILKELQFFKDRGAYVVILEIPTTQQDFSQMEKSMARMIMETINNMLIEMYAVFAQVEIDKKEKRHRGKSQVCPSSGKGIAEHQGCPP